jgi:hypothetical protein
MVEEVIIKSKYSSLLAITNKNMEKGTKKKEIILNKKGNYCLRCGRDKNEIYKEKIPCSLYGRNYEKHIYR